MAIDYTTPVGQIRILIPDVEEIPNSNRPMDLPEYLFSDDQILAFWVIGRQNVLRGAGHACNAIGSSEALISKVITTEDLATNGAALGNYWLNKAKELFVRADKEDAEEWDGFELVEFQLIPEHYEPR